MKTKVFGIIFLTLLGCKPEVNLEIYSCYDEGIKQATRKDKKILLVFTSFSDPTLSTESLIYENERVRSALEDYIVIWLRVDEMNLSNDSNIKLQVKKFGVNTQPMYCILDSHGVVVKDPIGYCISEKEFLQYISF